jgi:hypothetical protein
LSTASLVGGTPPYTCKWTASTAYYPPGYTAGTDTGSITVETYSYESERWTATITDSSTPPNVVSASIDSIVYGIDFEMVVGNFEGKIGNDNQTFDPLIVPGGPDAPLATINAGIKYAVPDNTYIYVASGTYAENPVINKKIYQIQSVDGETSASLGNGNYFIYATKEFGTSSLRQLNTLSGFSSSVFNTIGVSPSGSIQQALFDIEPTGTIRILAGVHEINTPISTSVGNGITFLGDQVPTGSGDTYYYAPASLLRKADGAFSLFHTGTTANNVGRYHVISNLALEKYETGSFITIASGDSRSYFLEMVKFRLITGSTALDMGIHNTTNQNNISLLGNIVTSPVGAKNISRHITDANDSGNGTGFVRFKNYAPFISTSGSLGVNGSTITYLYDFGFSSLTSGSVVGNPISILYNSFGSTNLQNALLDNFKPTLQIDQNIYNGLYYGKWGITNRVDSIPSQSLEVNINSGGSVNSSSYALVTFIPDAPSNTGRGVILKWGDSVRGFSLVLTGSRVGMNFHLSGSRPVGGAATSSVCMIGDITFGQQYIAEMFFDGNSTNKRVGMALYGTGSLITSSYFSSTDFGDTRVILPVIGVNNRIAAGCGVTHYRFDTFIKTAGTRTDFFSGSIAGILVDYGAHVGASNDITTSLYRWMRARYFPSSSIVQRAISSDN